MSMASSEDASTTMSVVDAPQDQLAAEGQAIMELDVPEATILGETFTAYTVVVRYGGGRVARVLKRYSTLSALSDALRAEDPKAWALLPPFPPKKFFGNNREVAFVAKRREALEAWFLAVGGGPLRASPALRAALRENDPDCEVHQATMRLSPTPMDDAGSQGAAAAATQKLGAATNTAVD